MLTCEHGGNRIPPEYRKLFFFHKSLLHSHKAFDKGARELFRTLSKKLKAMGFLSTTTRLLVDLNRSPESRSLFSFITRSLDEKERMSILLYHYTPYRKEVSQAVKRCSRKGFPLIHISIHTFAPLLKRKKRETDIGLLFDPSRKSERKFCLHLRKAMKIRFPGRLIRFNSPYKGTSDGLTSSLRCMFSEGRYLGIELEVNQKFARMKKHRWQSFRENLAICFEEVFQKAKRKP
ncbi:MAG: N-formylglutamate amidohydrolase [Candidatus Aureabacteria bacterium]|nr:N-formylglutamate amidohydrolase [Candidatus Auribacterota bacterium]